MPQPDEESLLDRLHRYPVERYPVQHATAQFHLGSALLQGGRTSPALAALAVARRLFADAGMSLETAKATLMLGVALRAAGELEEATAAFEAARELLRALGQPVEQAAASYNLGLVLQDRRDADGAHAAWDEAQELFLAAGYPGQAASAARDHGGSLLASGDMGAALPLLEQAAALAERAGDDAGTAAAANVLGLAHLALSDPVSAVEVLRRGLAFVPASVRPDEHAMIKANLALAYEHSGDAARARLAARQVLAVPAAAGAVRVQAEQLLSRCAGDASEDLLAVLADEPRDQWPAVVRDEALRAVALPRPQRCAVVRGFLDAVLARPDSAHALAETLLAAALELPPGTYSSLIESLVDATGGRSVADTGRLQSVFSSAMARFALPQWQRLAASVQAAAEASGRPATWR